MADDPLRELSKRIQPLFEKQCVLFAGSGVGKRAGLPDWNQYLSFLADVASEWEIETGALIRKRIDKGVLLEAAHLYKTCPEIPEGIRWARLVEPFARDKYDSSRLFSQAGPVSR